MKNPLGFIKKSLLKLAANSAVDYVLDNTLVPWTAKTVLKTDDILVENFLRPFAHDLVNKGLDGFNGISLDTYFKMAWKDGIKLMNNSVILDSMIADLQKQRDKLSPHFTIADLQKQRDKLSVKVPVKSLKNKKGRTAKNMKKK